MYVCKIRIQYLLTVSILFISIYNATFKATDNQPHRRDSYCLLSTFGNSWRTQNSSTTRFILFAAIS